MKEVIATGTGYHEGFRVLGDKFQIPDDMPDTSPWWKLATEPVEAAPPPPEEPTSFSAINKRSPRLKRGGQEV